MQNHKQRLYFADEFAFWLDLVMEGTLASCESQRHFRLHLIAKFVFQSNPLSKKRAYAFRTYSLPCIDIANQTRCDWSDCKCCEIWLIEWLLLYIKSTNKAKIKWKIWLKLQMEMFPIGCVPVSFFALHRNPNIDNGFKSRKVFSCENRFVRLSVSRKWRTISSKADNVSATKHRIHSNSLLVFPIYIRFYCYPFHSNMIWL